MTTTARPLTYQELVDTITALPPPPTRFRIYYNSFATKQKTVTRTWKERLFTLPWQPWQKHKTQSQPAIYRINVPTLTLLLTPSQYQVTIIIAHPSFQNAIEKALKGQPPQPRDLPGIICNFFYPGGTP